MKAVREETGPEGDTGTKWMKEGNWDSKQDTEKINNLEFPAISLQTPAARKLVLPQDCKL
jgi:hypothetical protein